ncbi:hypothetical protein JG688_00002645 [Phytophthora aleatoria]|uniref:Uncharacterized protein n=1 Tax=Phytophthora aleatoria TaxID=2496075 RepID=A0A8J5JF65_9STRA|nr:hypothetical protein JG688_00002645 [Phytophthora aleatoria]
MVERQHNELATCKSELHQLQRRLQQQTHYDEALDDALRRESVLKDAAAEQQARLKYLENVNASLVAALDSAKKELGSSQKEFSQIIEQQRAGAYQSQLKLAQQQLQNQAEADKTLSDSLMRERSNQQLEQQQIQQLTSMQTTLNESHQHESALEEELSKLQEHSQFVVHKNASLLMEVNNTRAQLDAMQLQHQQFTQRLQQLDTACRDSEQREMVLQTDITGCRSQRQELQQQLEQTLQRESGLKEEIDNLRSDQLSAEVNSLSIKKQLDSEFQNKLDVVKNEQRKTAERFQQKQQQDAQVIVGLQQRQQNILQEIEALQQKELQDQATIQFLEEEKQKGFAHIDYLVNLLNQEREEVDYMNCCINDAASDEA